MCLGNFAPYIRTTSQYSMGLWESHGEELAAEGIGVWMLERV